MHPSEKIIQQRPAQVDFNLQSMSEIYDRTKGVTDVPHRHDYYTTLLIKKATGKHIIDFEKYPLKDLEVHFVSPGQVHQVETTSRPTGWVITFSRTFLAQNNIPESFISNINLFKTFGSAPPLALDEPTLTKLVNIVSDMENCMPQELNYRSRALGALLQLFLIYANNSRALDAEQLEEENKSVCLLRDFKNLVDEKYADWHKVKDYASEIHISPKHLSQTVKDLTGKTAKTLIQDRQLLEAKRLLLHTNLSIKEIAYSIGFDEPLHFSGFFKKKSGTSPSTFRQ
ncbi:MAG: AraC family transcriptional regulator [Bacteroidota bacterium]